MIATTAHGAQESTMGHSGWLVTARFRLGHGGYLNGGLDLLACRRQNRHECRGCALDEDAALGESIAGDRQLDN